MRGETGGAHASVLREEAGTSSASAGQVRTTRLERALDWAAGLAPSPIRVATSCCGMSMVQGGEVFEALGTGPLAVSSRSADLLLVAGAITRRQVPMLRAIYERMLEPRWVIAWGACAISGGVYDNYATIPGLGRIVPVDLVVPGCPPAPTALREALLWLRSGEARGPGRRSRDPGEWPILRTPVETGNGSGAAGMALGNAEGRADAARENGNVDRG